MEEFTERLSRLAELGDDELDSLEQEMVASFDAADQAGSVDEMQALADALDTVRSEKANRTETAENETPAEVVEEVVAASGADEEDPKVKDETEEAVEVTAEAETADTEDAVETETTDDDEVIEPTVDEAEAVLEAEGAAEVQVTKIDGSNPTEEVAVETEVTAEEVPDKNKPALAATGAFTITAGGDIPGVTAGAQLDDMEAISEAMAAKVNSMRGVSGDGEYVMVASIRGDEAPEERTLSASDSIGNDRKIRALIEDPDALTAEALTAAGWCAPRAPVYDVPTIGTTDRPIANLLPTFSADRGGITWTAPPSLSGLIAQMTAAGDSAFGVFTAAGVATNLDGRAVATAGEKPCFTIPCGTDHTADLEAITLCLCFENMSARAYPEWIRANTDLLMVAQARLSEQYLLGKMFAATMPGGSGTRTAAGVAGAGTIGTPDIPLGAARDFLVTLRVAASEFRWANRLSPTQPLQVLVPSWLRDAIAADLAIQIPGDQTLSVSYAEVEGYLSDLNVQPVWYLDDAPPTTPAAVGGVPPVGLSAFDSPLGFAKTAEWLMFPTGTFVRLDGGSLDLGVVRSKDDMKKNTYCEFSETFEQVAYMGPDTPGLWVVHGSTDIEIRGGYAPAVGTIPATGVITE